MTVMCASLKVFNPNRNYSCKKENSFTPFSPSFRVPERAAPQFADCLVLCKCKFVCIQMLYFSKHKQACLDMIRTVMFIFILKMVT